MVSNLPVESNSRSTYPRVNLFIYLFSWDRSKCSSKLPKKKKERKRNITVIKNFQQVHFIIPYFLFSFVYLRFSRMFQGKKKQITSGRVDKRPQRVKGRWQSSARIHRLWIFERPKTGADSLGPTFHESHLPHYYITAIHCDDIPGDGKPRIARLTYIIYIDAYYNPGWLAGT